MNSERAGGFEVISAAFLARWFRPNAVQRSKVEHEIDLDLVNLAAELTHHLPNKEYNFVRLKCF